MCNDQLTSNDYKAMEKIINQTIAKLQRGLSYGEDMRSSRLVCIETAKSQLNAFIEDLKDQAS